MKEERFSRQSFLGPDSQRLISQCRIGVVGLGGGGSHIVQQLAHIGFCNFVIYDDDVVEESNLNRLIGGTSADVLAQSPKLHIAKMMVYRLNSSAKVTGVLSTWQEYPGPLKECQVVFGCVDGYQGRSELEVFCRRYLIHYIDIGMDVHGSNRSFIGGQVILSSPGKPCMRCMGFLTEEKLAKEAAKYGNAGSRPQVVWPNGVLASTAVGLAIDIITGWTGRSIGYEYLVYDGNLNTLTQSPMLRKLETHQCSHFPDDEVGEPVIGRL